MPADPLPADPLPADPVDRLPADPAPVEQGGDPVCWMHLLCPACGAMPEPDEAGANNGTCPRCGEERER